MRLTINTETKGQVFIAHVSGEVDAYTAPELRECLKQASAEGFYEIVIDMSEVPFIDSTGIGVLVGALRVARENNATVTLVSVRDNVRRVFELLGLDEQFALVDSI